MTLRDDLAELVGEATHLAVAADPDRWCGWSYECRDDVYAIVDKILQRLLTETTDAHP